jgi:hypothetical protein
MVEQMKWVVSMLVMTRVAETSEVTSHEMPTFIKVMSRVLCPLIFLLVIHGSFDVCISNIMLSNANCWNGGIETRYSF